MESDVDKLQREIRELEERQAKAVADATAAADGAKAAKAEQAKAEEQYKKALAEK